MSRRFKLIVAFVVAFLVADAALIAVVLTAHRSPEPATASGTAAIGGPFTLVAADGTTVTDQTYRGKWLLIYFGYTFCPDACPTALNNVSMALEKLGAEASKIQPLFITVDPERDTRQVMADYLKSFDSRIVGLTGSQTRIDDVAKTYRVYVARQKSGGDDYLVDHSAYLYLMNPEGKFVNVIPGAASGDEMADKLRKLMAHPGA